MHTCGLRAVTHEGRIVVNGIEAVLPLALVGDIWTELPPSPAGPRTPKSGGGGADDVSEMYMLAPLRL